MSGRFFRLVFFTPDPVFQTARFAVAALAEVDDVPCAVFARRLPCAQCAGGVATHRLLWNFVEMLPTRVTTIARLPDFAGPHFSLDEARRFPAGVDNPMKWVADFVLPGGKTP